MKIALERADIALGAIACILVGLIAYENMAPLPAFDVPNVSTPPSPPIPDVRPFIAPPQALFAAIDARPIFNPLREPIESTATSGSKASVKPPEAALVGVILDSKNQLALIKAAGAPFATSVSVGGSVEGWEVAEIAADHVVLISGAQEYTLRMDGKRSQQPSIPGIGIDRTVPKLGAPQAPVAARRLMAPEQKNDPVRQGPQDHDMGGK